jgi:hypothetical protein
MKYKNSRLSSYATVIRKTLKSFYKKENSFTKENTSGQEEECKASKSNVKWTDKILAIFTIILTLGTLALFYEAFQQTAEVKKEFELINTPNLQITYIVDSIWPGKQSKIYYRFENLGNDPAKILSGIFGDSINSDAYTNSFMIRPAIQAQINRFATKESPYMGQITTADPIPQDIYDRLIANQSFHYFYGSVIYKSQISGKERNYTFSIKIHRSPPFAIDMITNENYPVAK